MKIRFAGLFLLAGLFLMTACGQKGPLYLEKEPAPVAAAVDVEKDAAESKTESKSTDTPEKKD